jgi:hypothetical protein
MSQKLGEVFPQFGSETQGSCLPEAVDDSFGSNIASYGYCYGKL